MTPKSSPGSKIEPERVNSRRLIADDASLLKKLITCSGVNVNPFAGVNPAGSLAARLRSVDQRGERGALVGEDVGIDGVAEEQPARRHRDLDTVDAVLAVALGVPLGLQGLL